jgi:ABC-2 type transport system ATP-binding protein
MSTHDIFRAKDVSDTIGIMNEGVLVMERSAAELEGENLEQLYVQYMAGYEGSELASVPESVPDSEQRVETND